MLEPHIMTAASERANFWGDAIYYSLIDLFERRECAFPARR
jgi:hypothetical protein